MTAFFACSPSFPSKVPLHQITAQRTLTVDSFFSYIIVARLHPRAIPSRDPFLRSFVRLSHNFRELPCSTVRSGPFLYTLCCRIQVKSLWAPRQIRRSCNLFAGCPACSLRRKGFENHNPHFLDYVIGNSFDSPAFFREDPLAPYGASGASSIGSSYFAHVFETRLLPPITGVDLDSLRVCCTMLITVSTSGPTCFIQ